MTQIAQIDIFMGSDDGIIKLSGCLGRFSAGFNLNELEFELRESNAWLFISQRTETAQPYGTTFLCVCSRVFVFDICALRPYAKVTYCYVLSFANNVDDTTAPPYTITTLTLHGGQRAEPLLCAARCRAACRLLAAQQS